MRLTLSLNSTQLNGLRVSSQSDVQHQYELMRMRSKTFALHVDLLPLKLQLLYELSSKHQSTKHKLILFELPCTGEEFKVVRPWYT